MLETLHIQNQVCFVFLFKLPFIKVVSYRGLATCPYADVSDGSGHSTELKFKSFLLAFGTGFTKLLLEVTGKLRALQKVNLIRKETLFG